MSLQENCLCVSLPCHVLSQFPQQPDVPVVKTPPQNHEKLKLGGVNRKSLRMRTYEKRRVTAEKNEEGPDRTTNRLQNLEV
jgi:hypothetical protein